MSDYTHKRFTGILLELSGSYTLTAGWTDHIQNVSFDSKMLVSATEADFSALATLTADMESDVCEINNLPVGSQALAVNLQARYPYGEVKVTIISFKTSAPGTIDTSSVLYLWKGLVYQTKVHINADYIDIVSRNSKYYADIEAGVKCSEQCMVGRFGDVMCGKSVHSESVTVSSVTGTDIVLASTPTGVDYLYNSGYLEYQGLRIKIAYWKSGTSLSMSSAIPSEWVGKSMSIYAGCDRSITSCRDIHSNESNFRGWGFSMVDRDPLSEKG